LFFAGSPSPVVLCLIDHGTVNHSLDPETGVHTQAIESYKVKAIQKFKTMKGVSADALPTYLDERMWRDRFGKTTEAAFKNLCAHIAEQYKKSVRFLDPGSG
jgi:hypothetical protein